jgi:hypothetical protein
MTDRSIFISAEEMEKRASHEDPLDLTIEKWERLDAFLERAFSLDDYNMFLAACQVTIPFCVKYGASGECDLCPLVALCQGLEEDSDEPMWSGLFRLIQAYGWAGDMLPPEPLRQYVQRFIEVLKQKRGKSRNSNSTGRTGAIFD